MLHPKKLAAHELELVREKVRFERDLLLSNPYNFLLERVQEVAWRRGLANSVICSVEAESKISSDDLYDFYVRTLTHQGTSAVASGVGHEAFARSLPKVFDQLHYAKFGSMPFPASKYHGGEARFEVMGDLNYSTIAFPLQTGFGDLIGFAMAKIVEKLFVPQRSVQYGNSSSLLTKENPFNGIKTFNGSAQLYSNSGLLVFGLESSNSTAIKNALQRIKSAPNLCFSEEDLTKAKSSALFEFREAFDDRLGFLKAAAEQIVGSGRVFELAQVQQTLKSVTAEQVRKSVAQIFSNKPSLVHYGNLRELPYVDEL
jgi:predicted Zn-dependent peptidase